MSGPPSALLHLDFWVVDLVQDPEHVGSLKDPHHPNLILSCHGGACLHLLSASKKAKRPTKSSKWCSAMDSVWLLLFLPV